MSPEFEAMTIRQRQDALIAALRSGEHRQGEGRLRDDKGNECCLGVACGVAGLHTTHINGVGFSFHMGRSSDATYMPEGAWQLFGFYDNDGKEGGGPMSLADLNDGGTTFAEIAALLEPMDSPYWERAAPE